MNSLQSPVWDVGIGRRVVAGLWLAALVVSNAFLLLPAPLLLKATGGFLIFGLLPGAALTGALFSRDELGWEERIAFNVGMSVALSLEATWLYGIVAGRMSLPGLLALLDILALVAGLVALWRMREDRAHGPLRIVFTRGVFISIGLVLLVAFTCLLWLDYSDYDLDEVPVLDSAVEMILGDHAAVYHLAKGPAQIILSAAFILFGNSLTEGYVRVPFALMTIAAALAFLGLSKRLLGQPGAWVATLCLALDGFAISKGRVVQFQTLVFPFVFLAFTAFFIGTRAAGHGPRRRFQLAGAIFGGLALFSHYTGAFILPALAFLWLWSERENLRRRAAWLYAAVLAIIGGLGGGLFYILMLRQPDLANKVGSYYVGFRIGSGPFDMLNLIEAHIRLYEAPPWILFVGLGLVVLSLVVGRRLRRGPRALSMVYAASLCAVLMILLLPDLFIVATFNLAFVPFAILAVCLVASATISLEVRALGIWMLGALFVPAFWMQVPGNHYSLILPPAVLLSVLGWRALVLSAMRRMPSRVVPAVAGMAATVGLALAVWAFGYVYYMFIAHSPEYAVLYPENVPQSLAPFAGDLVEVKYNIPHDNGWRAIAALYDAGILRGEFRTNELNVPPNWYLSRRWKPDQPQPRYYFFVLNQQVPSLGSAPPAKLAEHYWLWGRITVAGDTHMLVYQLPDNQMPEQTRTLASEDFGGDWQRLASLTRLEAYKDLHRDDTAYYSVARFLEAEGAAGDAIVFDDPEEPGLLSQFYRGPVPYQRAVDGDSLSTYRRIWAILSPTPDRTTERALAQNACPAESQWFGNLRLTLNGTGNFGNPVAINVQLGEVARLRDYALERRLPHGGDVYCIQLDWKVLGPAERRLKLFMHLINADGKLAAQADMEPQAGFKPTTDWRAGEQFVDRVGLALPAQFAPGRYRLVGGLYDSQSGVRVSALASGGSRFPDDAVDFGTVTIQ